MKSARSSSLEEAILSNLGKDYIAPPSNPLEQSIMQAPTTPPKVPSIVQQTTAQDGWNLAVPTAYNGLDDIYGSKTAKANPATGKFQAIEGQTIAVDPAVIPYGSTVEVQMPDGSIKRYLAHDTGSAVKARTASKARGLDLPVIDFYSSRKDLNNVFGNEPIKWRIVQPTVVASR